MTAWWLAGQSRWPRRDGYIKRYLLHSLQKPPLAPSCTPNTPSSAVPPSPIIAEWSPPSQQMMDCYDLGATRRLLVHRRPPHVALLPSSDSSQSSAGVGTVEVSQKKTRQTSETFRFLEAARRHRSPVGVYFLSLTFAVVLVLLPPPPPPSSSLSSSSPSSSTEGSAVPLSASSALGTTFSS